jgi:hypothetical protein
MLPQSPLLQSVASVQFWPSEQLWQAGPPQSMSVSFSLRTPSRQSTWRELYVFGAGVVPAMMDTGGLQPQRQSYADGCVALFTRPSQACVIGRSWHED